MNFKRMKQLMIMAIFAGFSVGLNASTWMVTGDKAPDQSYQPLVPRLHDVQNFDQTDPADLTTARLQQFSATTVHGYATQTPAVVISPTPVLPSARAPISAPAAKFPSASRDSSGVSANGPCPEGYSAQPNISGNVVCSQSFPLLDGTVLGNTMEGTLLLPNGSTLGETLVVHPDGTGIIYEENFGTDNFYSCGEILDRVIEPSNGSLLYPAEYKNYFLASLQDAVAVAQIECHAGLHVTYVTGVWPAADNSNANPPSSGYQVQVADLVPGTNSGDGATADVSRIPPGDSDYCLTLPPPANGDGIPPS